MLLLQLVLCNYLLSTYYLSANKIIFNKENETFELFGNVLIIKDNKLNTK